MAYPRHTITVDFSGDHERELIGIGMVVQQSEKPGRRGAIVEEIAVAVRGVALGDGERYAVLCALELAAGRGFRNLTIRSDYNAMRRKLKASYQTRTWSHLEGIDRRILEFAERFERVHFGWIPRRKNQLAHQLARRARAFPAELDLR